MYEDYYFILELSYTATQSDIKKSYRRLAKKWHPDVNSSENATARMQSIVRAYLILKDNEARERYDKIHEFYFRQQDNESEEEKNNESFKPKAAGKQQQQSENDIPKRNYQSKTSVQHDPILNEWILKAKQQAKEFVFQSIQDAKGIATSGCKYTAYAIGITIAIFIAVLIIIFVWAIFKK